MTTKRNLIGLGIVLTSLMAACGTLAEPPTPVQTRQAEEQMTRVAGTADAQPSDTPQQEQQSSTNATNNDLLAQLPPGSNPDNGAAIFVEFHGIAGARCSACHRVDSNERLVGPGLLNIAQRAATRVEGVSAIDYIYTSIVDPGAYVVPDYPNIMPKNWAQALTEQQIYDVIAYLISLSEP